MTKQEIYDKVKAHLLTQGKRSTKYGPSGICVYRNPDGLKCAVGALIDDEHYRPDIECLASGHEAVQEALKKSGVVGNVDLLSALQDIHDFEEPSDWCAALETLARRRGLKP